MKNSPLVTIIVPVYNAEPFLRNCIKSILCQTYKNLEIILVDDGSTDQSLLMCEKLLKNDSRIKIIHQKNCGVSAARNAGIEVSKGEYVFFIDADDEVSNKYVETLVGNARQANNKILFGAAIKSINTNKCDGLSIKEDEIQEFNGGEYIKSVVEGEIHGSICKFLFINPKGRLEFDRTLSYMEDVVFLASYVKTFQVKTIVINGGAQYIYNNNPKSTSNNGSVKQYINICSSLNIINEITDKKYSNTILKNRIKYLRWQLNKCCTWRDRKELITYYRSAIGWYGNKGVSIVEKIFLILIKYNIKPIIWFYYKLHDMYNIGSKGEN